MFAKEKPAEYSSFDDSIDFGDFSSFDEEEFPFVTISNID